MVQPVQILAKLVERLQFLFADSGSLPDRAKRGGVWVFLGRGLTQAASLLRMVILARLLSPHDFGLMGIALFAVGCLETFTETGYHAALIQRSGDIRPYLNSVLIAQALRGLGLCGLLVAGAPWIAGFFRNLEAIPVIQAIAVLVLLRGLISPATILLQKELLFRRLFFWNLSEIFTGLTVGILLAVIYHNVWALVISTLVAGVVKTAGSYLVCPHRLSWQVDWALVRELSRFGRWVLGLNIVNFLALNLDQAVAGRVAGTSALGFYQLAYRLSNLPVTEVTQVLSSVTFPVYSKLQQDTPKVRRTFRAALWVTLTIGLPVVCFLTLLGDEVVRILLGAKWLEVTPILHVLALYGLCRMVAATGGALFLGLGQPQHDLRINLLRLIVLAIAVYPCAQRWGTVGVAWAAVVSIAVILPYWLVRCAVLLQTSPGTLLRQMLQPVVLAGLFFAGPIAVSRWVWPVETWWGLGLIAALGGVVYGLACLYLWPHSWLSPRSS